MITDDQGREVRAVFVRPPTPGSGTLPRRVSAVYTEHGRVFPPIMEPVEHEFTGGINGTIEYVDVPWWARFLDVVVLSGGGGGAGGDGAVNREGNGGRAGTWNSGTVSLSGMITGSQIAVTAGRGGPGGARETNGVGGQYSSAGAGSASVMAGSSVGGSGYGSAQGENRSAFTAFGRTFLGGSGGSRGNDATGRGAGGGGGPGGIFGGGGPGGRGSPGYVWIRFRSD